ncbi:ethyl tert-butyl ether degradation protein EthD [Actinomadura sp. GC306]|uniref:ethyl tert-butyl ether degradation protein EthD n=1 Tax=Actinomadura sp. GC306 TaxID=2530367 RepID=UPI001A9DA711|nr:ethyl tert-butyl ether degradation protein EthD [Actinomadura sp. GC306]
MDTAELENAAELALTAFCWWRSDLSRDVCETYWRDVHGIMFARAPGLWQYRQLRLAANRPDLWPAVPGVSFDVPDEAQPQGMPHGLFLAEADLAAFGGHPLPRETIPNDAHHFIGRIGEPAVQGPPPLPTFVVCLVPADGAPAEGFHRHLIERVARPWSEHPGVMRLRVEPLPPYGESAMSSPGVPLEWPGDETYLGWIELALRDESVVGDLPTGGLTGVKAVHTYPVREIYTITFGERPTEVGLRGYPAVQTIIAAGAGDQRGEDVLRRIFGDAARGRSA